MRYIIIVPLLLGLGGCGWESLPWTQQKVASNGKPCVKVGGDGFWLPAVYAMPDNHAKVCQ